MYSKLVITIILILLIIVCTLYFLSTNKALNKLYDKKNISNVFPKLLNTENFKNCDIKKKSREKTVQTILNKYLETNSKCLYKLNNDPIFELNFRRAYKDYIFKKMRSYIEELDNLDNLDNLTDDAYYSYLDILYNLPDCETLINNFKDEKKAKESKKAGEKNIDSEKLDEIESKINDLTNKLSNYNNSIVEEESKYINLIKSKGMCNKNVLDVDLDEKSGAVTNEYQQNHPLPEEESRAVEETINKKIKKKQKNKKINEKQNTVKQENSKYINSSNDIRNNIVNDNINYDNDIVKDEQQSNIDTQ